MKRQTLKKAADGKYCVVDAKTGQQECFATLAEAKARIQARNAKAKVKVKKSSCGCGK